MIGYFPLLVRGFCLVFFDFIQFVRPVAEFVKVLTACRGQEVSFVIGYLRLRFLYTIASAACEFLYLTSNT